MEMGSIRCKTFADAILSNSPGSDMQVEYSLHVSFVHQVGRTVCRLTAMSLLKIHVFLYVCVFLKSMAHIFKRPKTITSMLSVKVIFKIVTNCCSSIKVPKCFTFYNQLASYCSFRRTYLFVYESF